MIEFNYTTNFGLSDEKAITLWIIEIIGREGFELGEISYTFCDDTTLHKLNMEFLGHDTLTDILSFDYRVGKQLNGEIFISTDRVMANAKEFNVDVNEELRRVIIHGVLHFCGYKDKTRTEESAMRIKEDECLQLF